MTPQEKATVRLIVPAIGLGAVLYAVRCWWRGRHAAKRHPAGGWRCSECGAPLRDLEDAGTLPDGRVHRTRAYSRENGGTFLRADRWFPRAR